MKFSEMNGGGAASVKRARRELTLFEMLELLEDNPEQFFLPKKDALENIGYFYQKVKDFVIADMNVDTVSEDNEIDLDERLNAFVRNFWLNKKTQGPNEKDYIKYFNMLVFVFKEFDLNYQVTQRFIDFLRKREEILNFIQPSANKEGLSVHVLYDILEEIYDVEVGISHEYLNGMGKDKSGALVKIISLNLLYNGDEFKKKYIQKVVEFLLFCANDLSKLCLIHLKKEADFDDSELHKVVKEKKSELVALKKDYQPYQAELFNFLMNEKESENQVDNSVTLMEILTTFATKFLAEPRSAEEKMTVKEYIGQCITYAHGMDFALNYIELINMVGDSLDLVESLDLDFFDIDSSSFLNQNFSRAPDTSTFYGAGDAFSLDSDPNPFSEDKIKLRPEGLLSDASAVPQTSSLKAPKPLRGGQALTDYLNGNGFFSERYQVYDKPIRTEFCAIIKNLPEDQYLKSNNFMVEGIRGAFQKIQDNAQKSAVTQESNSVDTLLYDFHCAIKESFNKMYLPEYAHAERYQYATLDDMFRDAFLSCVRRVSDASTVDKVTDDLYAVICKDKNVIDLKDHLLELSINSTLRSREKPVVVVPQIDVQGRRVSFS